MQRERYALDWTSDDQPFELSVPGMLSVPYTVELNDLGILPGKGSTGPEFLQMLVCPSEASTELVRTLEEERDRMSRRIEHLARNRDAITTYLSRLPRSAEA